ncbi:hypothetical protein B0H17DRAFT_1141014 [Mycena rosella]|uniref:Uncharacterized protein n=1 Tax=Mycena rosella TaxID=1033263 RepID=A0AAD7D4E9_MYCRO|nr:hypothetical protein B0H17DRAFT_1141014 [Mycena rosella]
MSGFYKALWRHLGSIGVYRDTATSTTWMAVYHTKTRFQMLGLIQIRALFSYLRDGKMPSFMAPEIQRPRARLNWWKRQRTGRVILASVKQRAIRSSPSTKAQGEVQAADRLHSTSTPAAPFSVLAPPDEMAITACSLGECNTHLHEGVSARLIDKRALLREASGVENLTRPSELAGLLRGQGVPHSRDFQKTIMYGMLESSEGAKLTELHGYIGLSKCVEQF